MSVDKESLKRVLLNIKGAARGFKKDHLKSRLMPPAQDDVANPMDADPEAPLGLDAAEEASESPMEESGELAMGENAGAKPEDADAAAKLEMIRKLIGSV